MEQKSASPVFQDVAKQDPIATMKADQKTDFRKIRGTNNEHKLIIPQLVITTHIIHHQQQLRHNLLRH